MIAKATVRTILSFLQELWQRVKFKVGKPEVKMDRAANRADNMEAEVEKMFEVEKSCRRKWLNA